MTQIVINDKTYKMKEVVSVTKKETVTDCIEVDVNTKRPVFLWSHQSPKRPEFLVTDIYRVTKGKTDWLIFISLYDGKPYEVFAGPEENVSIPKKHKQGRIQKNNGYHLILGEGEDQLVIKNIPKAFESPEFATLTRLISFSLRHGGPVPYLVDQLTKDGAFDAFNKAVSRCLKKYIEDNENSTQKCPECNGRMTYVQGCLTCSCGYSKCS